HLETQRGNSARTRNARLAAIHSFFRFLEYRLVSCPDQACPIHAIPLKKADQALVGYLSRAEVTPLPHAPETPPDSGLRARAMLHLAFAAGLRVSELITLRIGQLDQQTFATIHVMGARACASVMEGNGRCYQKVACGPTQWRPGTVPQCRRLRHDAVWLRVHHCQARHHGCAQTAVNQNKTSLAARPEAHLHPPDTAGHKGHTQSLPVAWPCQP